MRHGFEAVIGLEVHVQLATKTKLFCACATGFGAAPNTSVCPVCLGHPGVLPVPNRAAVDLGLRLALALGCTIRPRSRFARKNYFYPDLPKGYQISQYDEPFASRGELGIDTGGAEKRIGITRIHLEEDAGKLLHGTGGAIGGQGGETLVDFNRAGVPLAECVSEPDLRSPAEAYEYLTELRAVVRAVGASQANLEEGSLRCDANVSLRRPGEPQFGTRVEVKNLNSFRNVEKALAYEIERQAARIGSAETVEQETRLFDAERGETHAMRFKEEAHDYRYFPDPDLPPLEIAQAWVAEARAGLPELPRARRERLVATLGLRRGDARILTLDTSLADLLEACVRAGAPPAEAAATILRDVLRWTKETGRAARAFPIAAPALAELLGLAAAGAISSAQKKSVLDQMIATGKSAARLVAEQGLAQVSDAAAIATVVRGVVAALPAEAARYRAGKTKLLGFFVAQVLKQMSQANPEVVSDLVAKELGGS